MIESFFLYWIKKNCSMPLWFKIRLVLNQIQLLLRTMRNGTKLIKASFIVADVVEILKIPRFGSGGKDFVI